MKRAIASVLVALMLCGCAGNPVVERMGHPDVFALCAATDIATTAVYLSVPGFHETNPIVNAVRIPALGKVMGTVVPAIALAVVIYYVLREINEPALTATAAALSCAAAVGNAALVM
jgi:uncharacterized membrane protein